MNDEQSSKDDYEKPFVDSPGEDLREPPLNESEIIISDPVIVDAPPSVTLIVSPESGVPYFTWGGVNRPLADLLVLASKFPEGGWEIKKAEPILMALGQDRYEVPRDYLLSILGTFYGTKKKDDILELLKSLPETAKYYLVVDY